MKREGCEGKGTLEGKGERWVEEKDMRGKGE